MSDPIEALPASSRALVRKTSQPSWITPMLATLTDQRFSDPGWIFERKLDGVRALAFRKGPGIDLLSRNRLDLSGRFPDVADALKEQSTIDFIVDGEVVAFEGRRTSFARLQQRSKRVFYYMFDLLHIDGWDITRLPLRDRKRFLRSALRFHDPLRLSTHRNERGESFYEEACRKGWEGLIAKRADAPYGHGRSRDWLKFKCVNEQELVIGGYTEPQGSRKGFGALLVGYYEGDDLHYAGKVGTGYNQKVLDDLKSKLARIEIHDSPFVDLIRPRKGVHWVTPRLVGQFGFTEWTKDGRLRHPTFLGLRRDKSPRDVVRERGS